MFVLVASPSRERVEHYRVLGAEVELAVGPINGEHGQLGNPPVHYLNQSYPRRKWPPCFLLPM